MINELFGRLNKENLDIVNSPVSAVQVGSIIDLTKDGTPFMQLPRIVEGLFLGPSHHSIGLQCADLVVAMTANAERGPGQGRGYLKQCLPRFARHPATGELDGVGIKRFPEQVPRERRRNRLF